MPLKGYPILLISGSFFNDLAALETVRRVTLVFLIVEHSRPMNGKPLMSGMFNLMFPMTVNTTGPPYIIIPLDGMTVDEILIATQSRLMPCYVMDNSEG
jgi:hypothetical protein